MPNTQFDIFYSLAYNEGKNNLIQSYHSMAHQIIKYHHSESIILQLVENNRIKGDNGRIHIASAIVDEYLKKYEIVLGLSTDKVKSDAYKKIIPNNIKFYRVFNMPDLAQNYWAIRNKLMKFNPNEKNIAQKSPKIKGKN